MKTGARKCRGFESHPLRQVAVLAARVVAICALLVACSFLPGRQFAFAFPPSGIAPEIRGVLTDKTGGVLRVATIQRVDPAPMMDRGMATFADRPNEVVVYWIGGACDRDIQILVAPEGGVTITVTTPPTAEVCELVGFPRNVLIEFAAPLDMSRTTVRFDP